VVASDKENNSADLIWLGNKNVHVKLHIMVAFTMYPFGIFVPRQQITFYLLKNHQNKVQQE